ncbi:ATP-binding protein [Pseudomonas syringae]|uniref:HD domain-containing protein n=1 Tax=Pseudomonas syringae TaxID=317 RepID=UPI002FDB424F|nr:ATP-binding protein [Pseudomonas syringae]
MRLIGLEKIFEEACEKHEHLKLLQSQWRFDRELIAKALQNISSVFPHYSRHDSSHSKQIIVNIERMLGERIYHLTATDMWLILEAAYCHDIGMVVTHKQIQDMDSPEFKVYVKDIAAQHDHELNNFAIRWDAGSATLPAGANAQTFFNDYKRLLAEWYRRKHPQNAAKIIHDPFDEIGLSSPRNELLPKRLFGALAAICNAHGEAFDHVMKLPFSEAGMATEDCHPRYVAFLLRMADLLDVDDNRFCPVMMRMSGESLPPSSHAHLEKHQAIRHFRLDSERIEIEVVCPTPESYEVAHDWFKWLEQEYHSQSQRWPKIVPNKKLGRLPTLSPPKVSLRDPYVVITEGKRPNFDLDQTAILRLLRGTGLYTSKVDSIREVLQNAVDSTIISIWQQYKSEVSGLSPDKARMQEIYAEKPIVVDFQPSVADPNLFTLSVKDFGTGVSSDDLKRILKVGSSSKTSDRARLIREMPEWFKPSGNFGIGLQSVSLLSSQFRIASKSRTKGEAFEITFNLDLNGSVVVKQVDPEGLDFGATVSIEIRIDDFPKTMSIPWGRERENLMLTMKGYDFTEPGSDLKVYEQIQVHQAILDFSHGSPIKISSFHQGASLSAKEVFFVGDLNISLSNVKFGPWSSLNIRTLFRGQPFKGLEGAVSYAMCEVDFHGFAAIDFLTYNREKILPNIKSEAIELLNRAILRFIEEKFDFLDGPERPYAAAFYFCSPYHSDERRKYYSDLVKYPVKLYGRDEMPLGAVIKAIKDKQLIDFEIEEGSLSGEGASRALQTTRAVIVSTPKENTLRLIKLLGTSEGMFWQERTTEASFQYLCSWSSDDLIPVDREIMRDIISGTYDDVPIGKRIIFPVWGQYRKLAISRPPQWAREITHLSFKNEFLVLPYSFEFKGPTVPDLSDGLLSWVYEYRSDDAVTAEEILELYEAMIAEITEFLKG